MNRTFKKLISLITTLTICTSMVGIINVSAADGFSGSGTENDPYLIKTVDDLKRIKDNIANGDYGSGQYFSLANDIVLTEADGFNGIETGYYQLPDKSWEQTYFGGTFDGNGHKISGFSYETYTACKSNGFFECNKGTIKNLSVEGNIVITVSDTPLPVGGIAGINDGGTIENCFFGGSISYNLDSNAVAAPGNAVGGIVGNNLNNGIIRNCGNTADITVDCVASILHVGGILGCSGNGYQDPSFTTDVYNSFNTGTISVEGTVTDSRDGTVYNLKEANVGGIVGWCGNAVNCFNISEILVQAETPHVGQMVGWYGSIKNCFYGWWGTKYQTLALTPADAVATVDDNGAIQKTEEQFASGEVAYLLNNSSSGNNVAWRQTLGTNPIPTLSSASSIVYNNSGTYANSAAKRPLTVEYMGMGNAPTATGKKSASLTSEDISSSSSDKPFWIGLAVEKVHDMDLFTNGVYSLEVAFEYNPLYIRPVIGSGDTETKWHDEIVAANIGSDKAWNEKYTVVSVTETDLDTESDRADKGSLSSRSNWKMCVVCITLDAENDTDLRFKGLDQQADAADKKYLLNIPFRLVKAPAEGDSDMNPTVLSLVRGPETFNIGSGKTGESPKAKWNDTENQNDAENLQTYFNYPNDIKLFGAGVSITDIVPFRVEDQLDENGNPKKDGDGKVLTEEKDYPLSQDATLQGEGFNAELTSDPHYRSLSNLPDNLQLRITADDMPTVKVNGTAVNVTLKDGKYITDPFSLNELDKTVNNGFNNTITVQDSGGSTEYTIRVRRLLQPRIELNYGNSPYAEIEKAFGPKDSMSDAEKTAAEQKVKDAKADFIKANKYTAAYVPEAFKDNTSNIYTPEAWVGEYPKNDDGQPVKDLVNKELDTELIDKISNPEINLDRNLYTIFAYGRQDFNDTGFTATDSLGNDVSNSVERSIEIKRIRKFNRNYKVDSAKVGEDVETFKFTDGSVHDLSNITKDKEVDGESDPMLTRPGIYDLVYTFTDSTMPANKQKVSITRKIVVIPKLGDVNMYNDIDPADATDIYAHCKGTSDIINKTIAGDIENLFLYRVVDVNHINGVDPADTTNIYAQCKGKPGSIKEMYKITK